MNRANGLRTFLKDGRIEIDNNPAENAIHPRHRKEKLAL
ncbi:transposase [Neobacillus drentensis]|nr:transposase [Neobacillus drentensis]ULT56774.1 transposase [Neobacillus drentensis]